MATNEIKKVCPELLKQLSDIHFSDDGVDLLWVLLCGMNRNYNLMDGVSRVLETYEDIEHALPIALAIREELQASTDEALKGKVFYIDQVIDWYQSLLKDRE